MRFTREADPFAPLTKTASFSVEYAAVSDIGRHRGNNEDALLVGDLARDRPLVGPRAAGHANVMAGRFVCAVLDGMGGEAGGEIASKLATETLYLAMRERAPLHADEDAVAAALVESIQAASARIAAVAREQPEYRHMGTTVTAAAFARGTLIVGQVGDSRLYLFRDDALTAVTRDQTLKQMMIDSGRMTAEEAERFDGGHIILQALGSSRDLVVAITRVPLQRGDTLLLCSDGLTGPVTDDAIAAILREHRAPASACEALVTKANDAGGPDNVSCIVLRIA